MNSLQIENQISNYLRGLPVEYLQEILDFIKFIREKKLKDEQYSDVERDISFLNKTEIEHLENEMINYKELYPYES